MGEVETLPPTPTMPHPLPDDVNAVTGLKWFLAAVPDDPAFTRAAWDIFTELANYWKWGKEGPVPNDSDKAAQLWANAVYETIEAYKMGFPETLLGYIDEIEDLLRFMQTAACCYDQDATGGEIYTDNVEDGVGDVPQNIIDAGYATGASDWAGFEAYKCMIAHVVVDLARRRLELGAELLDDAGESIPGGIGAVVAVLGAIFALATGGWVALVAGLVASVGAAAEFYDNILELGGPALQGISDDLETNRDAIACAIMDADGPAAAESAFYTAVTDEVGAVAGSVVSFLNIGPSLRGLYGGRYDTQNVAQALSDNGFTPGGYTCDCPEPPVSLGVRAFKTSGNDSQIFYNGAWQNLVSTATPYFELFTNTDYLFRGDQFGIGSFQLDDSGITTLSITVTAVNTANWNRLRWFGEDLITDFYHDTPEALPITHNGAGMTFRNFEPSMGRYITVRFAVAA